MPRLHLFHVKYNCTPNLHMEVQRQSRKSCKTALFHDVTSERKEAFRVSINNSSQTPSYGTSDMAEYDLSF
jgi:hypothetical protein